MVQSRRMGFKYVFILQDETRFWVSPNIVAVVVVVVVVLLISNLIPKYKSND